MSTPAPSQPDGTHRCYSGVPVTSRGEHANPLDEHAAAAGEPASAKERAAAGELSADKGQTTDKRQTTARETISQRVPTARYAAPVRSSTWLTTILAPIAAVAIAWCLAFLCMLVLPTLPSTIRHELVDFGLSWKGGSLAHYSTLALRYTAMALSGWLTIRSGDVTSTSWTPTLTLTIVIAVVIYAAHRREFRRNPTGASRIALPRVVSGLVLASLAGLLIRFSTAHSGTFSEGEPVTTTIAPSPAGIVFGFLLGFLAVALAWSFADRPRAADRFQRIQRPASTYSLSLRAISHATRVSLAFFIVAPLVAGLGAGLLDLVDQIFFGSALPATALIFRIPTLYTTGVFSMLGAFGGLRYHGPVTEDVRSYRSFRPVYETQQIFADESPLYYGLALLVIAVLVYFARLWGRTRDPRTESGLGNRLCAPVLFTLIGVVLIRITAQSLSSDRPVGPYGTGGAHYYHNGLTWTDLVWFFAFGVVFELLAAFFSWRQTRTTTHHEQAAARQRADVLWLVTFLAPLAAVAAAGGLALLCASALPYAPAEVQEAGSRFGLWWYSNPDADTLALAFRTTALALCATFTTTTYIDNVDYHSYEVATGAWLPALTLTVVVTLVIFAAHRLEVRDPRHATAVRAPAIYSGITLAFLTQVIRLQTNKTFSTEDRVYRFDTDVSFPLSGLLLAFLIGLIPVLLARTTGATRTTGSTRTTDTAHTADVTRRKRQRRSLGVLRTPKVMQALRVALSFLIVTPLVAGFVSVIIETLPLTAPSAAFAVAAPYLYNIGVFTMLGSLGGFAQSGPVAAEAGSTTRLILSDFSPINYCLSIVVLAFVACFAVVWARTGQPLAHRKRDALILPAATTALGVLLILTDTVKLISTAPVGPYATSGAMTYTLSVSWLSVLWFFALGVSIECLARVIARSARFRLWAAKPPRSERRLQRRGEQKQRHEQLQHDDALDFSLLPDVPTGHPDTDPHAAPSSTPAL